MELNSVRMWHFWSHILLLKIFLSINQKKKDEIRVKIYSELWQNGINLQKDFPAELRSVSFSGKINIHLTEYQAYKEINKLYKACLSWERTDSVEALWLSLKFVPFFWLESRTRGQMMSNSAPIVKSIEALWLLAT